MLDLKLLTTFREVALRRSFSDAAHALGYTQPAVSQHVSRLEATLGVRLLERDARGVHPTPAGELLLTRAAALLDAARRAEDDVREAAGAGSLTVRIGAFATLAGGLLPAATRALRAPRPDAGRDALPAGAAPPPAPRSQDPRARGERRRAPGRPPRRRDDHRLRAAADGRAPRRRARPPLRRPAARRHGHRPPDGRPREHQPRGAVRGGLAHARRRRNLPGLQHRAARVPRRGLRARRAAGLR